MEDTKYNFLPVKANLESGGMFKSDRIKVEYDPDKSSVYELAGKIIKTAIEPVLELERHDFLKGVRVIFHGGAVSKLQEPKDYDLLIVYDAAEIRDKESGLSPHGEHLKRQIFGVNGLTEEITYAIDVKPSVYGNSERGNLLPKFVDVCLFSKEQFSKLLEEPQDAVKQKAFEELSRLPSVVISDNEKYGAYYWDIESEDADRNGAIVLCLVLGKIYKHIFSQPELEKMGTSMFGRPGEFGKFVEQSGPDCDKYLTEHLYLIQKLLQESTWQKLGEYLGGKLDNNNEVRILANDLVSEFGESLERDTRSHFKWVYQGIISGGSQEAGVITSGQLIYGPNIQVGGKNLFQEDRSFIDF